MKQQTMNNKDRLTIAASTGLSLYSIYKIIFLSSAFKPLQSFEFTFGVAPKYLLVYSIPLWNLLALGLCGLVLVYANINKNKEIGFHNRNIKIKKIVFSTLIVFSTGSIFVILYNTYSSYQAYQKHIAQGFDMVYRSFQIDFIIIAFSTIILIGEILFGIYVITKREGLLNPFMIIYFTGFIFSLIIKTHSFVTAIINERLMIADPSLLSIFGLTKNYIFDNIIYFSSFILVMATSLIIILYGIKKDKITESE